MPGPYVIYVSVDGLRSGDDTRNLQTLIDIGLAPNFARLQAEGAWTHQARNDVTLTITLPNHTSMLTGRPVLGAGSAQGHGYVNNTDPDDIPDIPVPGLNLSTVHTAAGEYVPSVFNVVHDAGLSTAMYASKTKFSLYDASYDGVDQPSDPAFENDPAAMDVNGPDNGADKLDLYHYDGDAAAMVDRLVADAEGGGLKNFTFVHIDLPDSAGHDQGWGSEAYLQAIQETDALIGQILDLLQSEPYAGQSQLILTADHGGGGDVIVDDNHANPLSPLNFTVPFYVWGEGVAAGADLYDLQSTRTEPDPNLNPSLLTESLLGVPIRNADGGNLALDLLGLSAIPTSSINALQDLNVFAVAPSFGDDGRDVMRGVDGNEGLDGRGGRDLLLGGAGNDVLEGADGGDQLRGGAGDDRLNGGAGTDVASYVQARAGVTVRLDLATAQATGGSGTDTLIAVEALTGSDHADRLTGSAGANTLRGGAGEDVLTGGGGRDLLVGGEDADRFVFLSASDSAGRHADRIADFLAGQDRIDLSAVDADANATGDQAFAFIGAAGFSRTAGELRIQAEGGDLLVAADIDGDGRADLRILLTGGSVLEAGDFLL